MSSLQIPDVMMATHGPSSAAQTVLLQSVLPKSVPVLAHETDTGLVSQLGPLTHTEVGSGEILSSLEQESGSSRHIHTCARDRSRKPESLKAQSGVGE